MKIWQDMSYALRIFAKSPRFATVAVLTLALGIGANAAIFSALYGIVLRPLPFVESDRLVRVDEIDTTGKWAKSGISWTRMLASNYEYLRDQNSSFEQFAAWMQSDFALSIGNQPQSIRGASITINLLSVLRVRPVIGRAFLPAEETAEQSHVLIISYALWQQAFGGSRDVLGREISLDGYPYTVIGVMGQAFEFPIGSDIVAWKPLVPPKGPEADRIYVNTIARLKRNTTVKEAQSELDVLLNRLHRIAPGGGPLATSVARLKDTLVAKQRLSFWILFAAVVLVLAIAGANVAGLCLVRIESRQSELALRIALGGSRLRITQQLLTESLVLALAGGALGLLLAFLATRVLVPLTPAGIPRAHAVHIDSIVSLFTLSVSILTGVSFGLISALHACRPVIHTLLKHSADRAHTGRQTMKNMVLVTQLALAVVLLAGAGLMIRTLLKLHSSYPGFDPNRIVVCRISLRRMAYSDPGRQRAFFDQVLNRTESLPEVESTAAISTLPSHADTSLHLRQIFDGWREVNMFFSIKATTPEFFNTMRIPLIRGRWFSTVENNGSAEVALINETMARQPWWGPHGPIGQALPTLHEKKSMIVGVVGDTRNPGADSEAHPEMYVPFAQAPRSSMWLIVRLRTEGAGVGPALRSAVQAIDPAQPVDSIRTMDDVLSASAADRRFYMLLLSLFATLALVLAVIGVFGVVSYTVSRRQREIGIRMALGSQQHMIVRMILVQSTTPMVVGLALGIAAALAATRLLRALLFELSPQDPLTLVTVTLLLAGCSLLAAFIPANRAASVDPVVALRYE